MGVAHFWGGVAFWGVGILLSVDFLILGVLGATSTLFMASSGFLKIIFAGSSVPPATRGTGLVICCFQSLGLLVGVVCRSVTVQTWSPLASSGVVDMLGSVESSMFSMGGYNLVDLGAGREFSAELVAIGVIFAGSSVPPAPGVTGFIFLTGPAGLGF